MYFERVKHFADLPDLADPAHDPVRGELARLLIAHKADIGLADRGDAVIVERVDDIAGFMFERHCRALLANDTDGWNASYGSGKAVTDCRTISPPCHSTDECKSIGNTVDVLHFYGTLDESVSIT